MTNYEKFLRECDPDNGGDYSHDDVAKLIAMVRYLSQLDEVVTADYCVTIENQLNKIAKGE